MNKRRAILRVATSTRVATQWIEMDTLSHTLSGHSQRLKEIDVALATSFRDKVIETLRSQAQSICQDSRVQTHLDGDKTLHVQLSAVAGKHPATLLIVRIPEGCFFQHAFQANAKPTISEGYTEESVACPPINKANTTSQVAEIVLGALQKYMEEGGPQKMKRSGLPSAVEK